MDKPICPVCERWTLVEDENHSLHCDSCLLTFKCEAKIDIVHLADTVVDLSYKVCSLERQVKELRERGLNDEKEENSGEKTDIQGGST